MKSKRNPDHQPNCACTTCSPGAKVYEIMSPESYTTIANWATSLTKSEAKDFGRMLAR